MKQILFFVLLLSPLMSCADPKNDIKTKKEVLTNTSQISPQQLLDVVDAQLKAIRANDLEKAYNDYTSTEFRKNVSLDEFKQLIARFQPLAKNKLFQFQSFYVEDDIASFGGELLSVEGNTIPVEYDFVSESGKWKILGIQVYRNELSIPHD